MEVFFVSNRKTAIYDSINRSVTLGRIEKLTGKRGAKGMA